MPRSAPPGSLIDAVTDATQRYRRAYPSVVLGVGITHGGKHHEQALRAGEGPAPAMDALYELGFLSQVFTGALLAVLVDRGEVRLDTPLKELIPPVLLPDEVAGRITLEQLATHTSGMPRLPPNLRTPQQNPADPYGHFSAELFGAFLRSYHPRRPPPGRHAESVIGLGVLGHALSRRAKLNYGHALRDLLCTPLDLSDTTAVRLSEEQERRLMPGHSAKGTPVPSWTFPALPGAGAVRSTVPDLLYFLDANLGHVETALERALKLTHVPRVRLRGRGVGLGWNVSERGGRTVLWRSAVTGGSAGFIGFSPEADAGVVVLSDRAGDWLASLLGRVPVEEIGFTLLARFLRAPAR